MSDILDGDVPDIPSRDVLPLPDFLTPATDHEWAGWVRYLCDEAARTGGRLHLNRKMRADLTRLADRLREIANSK